ncbi:MAG: hypothetical protein IJF18_05325 [Oscillospiraceae bacterium]|nr:hypothetical protein [Oscillospiraceae bacterium]
MEFIVILVLLWLVSPIVFFILFLTQMSRANTYKQLNEKLNEENRLLRETLFSKNAPKSEPAPQEETQSAEPPPETRSADTVQPETPAAETVSEEAVKAEPVKPEPAKVTVNSAYNMSYARNVAQPAPQPKTEPVKTAPAQPKQKVSSINVLLILGALFIITAGLIFATTTWEFLPSGLRAVVILSFSAIFFAASSLAERKFSLEKTGILFYTLGSVFLPITLIAAGHFKVFGEWFSLYGNGRPLLLAITFAALSAVCLKGGCDYRHKVFSWCGLVSFSASICALILQFTDNMAVFALIASIYGFGMIFACQALSKIDSEKAEPILSQLNSFSAVNTIILSLSSLAAMFVCDNGALSLASCAIFAAGYLKNQFTEKNGFAGAVPFTVFVTCGMFAAFSPDDFSGIACTLVISSAIPAVLSFMNFIPDKLKSAVTFISNAFAVITAVICTLSAFFAEPSLLALGAYAILAAEILALSIIHRSEKSGALMKSVFPLSCTILAVLGTRLIFENDSEYSAGFYVPLVTAAFALLLQGLFVFVKPLKLRTVASDFIYSAVSLICGFMLIAAAEYPEGIPMCLLYTGGFAITAVTMLLPAFSAENDAERVPFIVLSMLWGGFLIVPIAKLLPDMEGSTILFASLAVTAVYTVISVVLSCLNKNRAIDNAVSVSARITIAAYVIAVMFFESYASPLLAVLAAICIFRAVKHGVTGELVCGLAFTFTAAGFASYDIFNVEFTETWLFVCGAAALVYLGSIFVPEGKFTKAAETTSRWALFAMNLMCMIEIGFSNEWNPVYTVITAVFFLLSVTSFYNKSFTPPLLASIGIAYPVFVVALEDYFREAKLFGYWSKDWFVLDFSEWSPVGLAVAVIMMLTVIPSYLLHKNSLSEKKDGGIMLDVFAFTRFIGFFCYVGSTHDDISRWCGIWLFTLCLLTLCRKGQKPMFRKAIYTISALMPVIACFTQPFFNVPEIIELEFNIVPVLLYCFAMRFMWKEKLPVVDNITFVVYILSYLILFGDALSGGHVADGLIIVISSLAMLILSFMIKKKKWFVLSVTVLVVSTLFMSRNFWASLAWWVYLLAAGLLLIAIGAANELKKQSADKHEGSEFKQKLTRFMSEWTW